jgi:hypothetical protein
MRRETKDDYNRTQSWSAGIVLPESFAEATSVTRLGDFPLIVLTASHSISEMPN